MPKKSKLIFKESGRNYKQLANVEWSQNSQSVSIVIKDDRIKKASKIRLILIESLGFTINYTIILKWKFCSLGGFIEFWFSVFEIQLLQFSFLKFYFKVTLD